MRITYPAMILASLACAPAYAADNGKWTGEQIATMRIDGEVEVDTQGRVSSYKLATPLEQELRTMLDRAIAKWSFEPPKSEGKPASARGKMRITLAGTFKGKALVVRVDNVRIQQGASTGDTLDYVSKTLPMNIVSMTPAIKHPPIGAEAILTMAVNISPNGKMLNTWATQCSVLSRARGLRMNEICGEFARSATRAIRQWRAAPAPGAPTPNQPFAAAIPIHFLLDQSAIDESPGKWRAEWRTNYRQPPWLMADAPRVGTSDAAPGGMLVADDDGLRLQEGATGTSL